MVNLLLKNFPTSLNRQGSFIIYSHWLTTEPSPQPEEFIQNLVSLIYILIISSYSTFPHTVFYLLQLNICEQLSSRSMFYIFHLFHLPLFGCLTFAEDFNLRCLSLYRFFILLLIFPLMSKCSL